MAKIIRYGGNLQPFGINAVGTERTVFGDVFQSDTLADNINTDYFRGWGIVGVNENPTKQDFNALGFTQGQVLAYLHQAGVPEYHAAQEYFAGGSCQVGGQLYISQVDGNIGNTPIGDSGANWAAHGLTQVNDLATLGAMAGSAGRHIYTKHRATAGDGGGGLWRWDGSNLSAQVTADAQEGVYKAPDSDPTGASGAWVRVFDGALNVRWFGAKGDNTADDTVAIQAAIDLRVTGKLYLPSGIYKISSGLVVQHPLHVFGDGGAHDALRTDFDGTWLRLAAATTLPADTAILTVTHDDLVPSDTHRTFALVENIGIHGNLGGSAAGHGLEVSAKNVTVRRVSILECDGTGLVVRDKDAAGSDNDGANACVFENLWIGYNTGYGVDLRRDVYSGDTTFKGGHIFWNDDDGMYCNQVNVSLIGTHIWWNLNGLTIDGTLGAFVQTTGVRIYDNAKSGVRLINAPNLINIAGDIHSNGRQDRIDAYPVPPTVTTNEKAAVYIDTPATNVMLDNLNVGYLQDSQDQYYGVRVTDAAARVSIGTVISDGATSTQWDRAIVLTSPTNNATLHGDHTKSDMSHPGFISKGDINLNSNSISNVDTLSMWAWDVNTVAAGVLTATSTTVVLNEAAPTSITDIAVDAGFVGQLPIIIFRNAGANAITFTHDIVKIRNISGANIVLGQHESVGYIAVSAGVYQQVMGKI